MRPGRARTPTSTRSPARTPAAATRTACIGNLPKSLIDDLAANCEGEVSTDAGRPAGSAASAWPADPYPDPDPERHAFQIRLTVEEDGNAANFGRYRKTLFAYEDDGNLDGWPRPIGSGSDADAHVTGSGGEVSPRLYDVNGDNELDVIETTTSGELTVLDSDGTPITSFNGGDPVTTGRYALEQAHPGPGRAPDAPKESPRVPAIGDIDGDLEPEIVLNAGRARLRLGHGGEPAARLRRRPRRRGARPQPLGALPRRRGGEALLRHRATAASPPRTTSSAASSARSRSPTSTATRTSR